MASLLSILNFAFFKSSKTYRVNEACLLFDKRNYKNTYIYMYGNSVFQFINLLLLVEVIL